MEGHLPTVCVLILILGAIVHSDALAALKPAKGVKPGVCPPFTLSVRWSCTTREKDRCQQDSHCPGSLKCCRSGCVRVCVRPRQLPPPPPPPIKPGVCPRFYWSKRVRCSVRGLRKCRYDYNCPGSLKCCNNGCGRVCVRPRQQVKPGVCPPFTWSKLLKCSVKGLRRCSGDSRCPGRQKCCYNGCGMICVQPRRPGVCPRFYWSKRGRCSVKGLRRCRYDYNCPRGLKCCFNGCGHVCVRPGRPEKPGWCPRFTWSRKVRCSVIGRRRCSDDYNCPGSLKCCNNGCGRVCALPRGLIQRGRHFRPALKTQTSQPLTSLSPEE